jgi:hypothetical protein
LFFSYCGSVAAHFKYAATRQPRRNSTAETCFHNTAKLRPQASALALRAEGASQLLKPASTTPRSYGRRHRPWHHGHVHATHNERRRGQRPVHHDRTCVVPRASAWAPRSSTCDAQRAAPREKASGRNDEVPATHNERRREPWPKHHDHPPLVVQRLLKLPRRHCKTIPSIILAIITTIIPIKIL